MVGMRNSGRRSWRFTAVLFVLWCGGLDAQEAIPAPPPAPPALPAGVIARLNGRDVRVEDYVAYLFASLGKSRLDEFLDRMLLEEEARVLGIVVPAESVESALEERIERTIKGLYQGKREDFLQGLTRRRSTLEEHRAKLRQDLYYEMLTTEVVLKNRQVTEADLRRQFDRSYGEGGIQLVLRHILFAGQAGTPPGPQDPTRPSPPGAASRATPEARERAEKALKEIQSGLSFAQAVKQYSDDAFTKKNDGRIPHYRQGFYGDPFHAAVMLLTAEKPLSGIVESPRGYHLIELVERQVTRFEDVKGEVEKIVRTQAPSPGEKRDLANQLRAKASVEGL